MHLGIFKWITEKRSGTSLKDMNEHWLRILGAAPVKSGVDVTESTALRSSVVFACVRLISGTVASLPLPVYKRLEPRGKQRDSTHSLYYILHDRPNEYTSSYLFRQTAVAHQLLWGNAYAEVEFDKNGGVKALWLLPPWRQQFRFKTSKPFIFLTLLIFVHMYQIRRNLSQNHIFCYDLEITLKGPENAKKLLF